MILIKKAHFLNFVKSPRPVLRDWSSRIGPPRLVLSSKIWVTIFRFEFHESFRGDGVTKNSSNFLSPIKLRFCFVVFCFLFKKTGEQSMARQTMTVNQVGSNPCDRLNNRKDTLLHFNIWILSRSFSFVNNLCSKFGLCQKTHECKFYCSKINTLPQKMYKLSKTKFSCFEGARGDINQIFHTQCSSKEHW